MTHSIYLEKDVRINNKDIKSNKTKSTTKSDGKVRANTKYDRHRETYESAATVEKLSQLDTLIHSWVVSYDDIVIVYSTSKQKPVVQVQLVNPKFKPVHNSMYKQLRLDPLANMGITFARDITTNTYYYTIPL